MRVWIDQPPFPGIPLSPERPWEPVHEWPAFWIQPPVEWRKPWVVAFSCDFTLAAGCSERLHVSADERYELYLDGKLIGRGSERGDLRIWHYETYALELSAGAHTLTARVWALGATLAPWAQLSVEAGFFCSPETPALVEKLATGVADWRVLQLDAYAFTDQRPAAGTGMGVGPAERFDGARIPWGWERGEGGAGQPAIKGVGGNHGFSYYSTRPTHWLRPASLPPPHDARWRQFRLVAGQAEIGAEWESLLTRDCPLTVPAHSTRVVLIDLVDYLCAYPELHWSGGAGARFALGWSETLRDPVTGEKKRGDVTAHDVFVGALDEVISAGGTGRWWRPIWWRCGRFIKIEIETADEPFVLERLVFNETRYAFAPESRWDAPGELATLFPVCVRTLQMCLHETYMDCPYYEQLMYAGDTRLQCLLTYVLGTEQRMPRKCIELFDSSRINGSGLTAAVHPSNGAQIIGPFSLWWIAMVYDYARWRDDLPFVRARLPGVRAVLDQFLATIDEAGLLRTPDGWNFVDWAFLPGGIPAGGEPGGATAVIQTQLVLALQQTAEMETHAGEPELATRYQRHAERLGASLISVFWDDVRGLLADDIAHTTYSEHAQCLGIITGVLTPNKAQRAWTGMLAANSTLTRVSVYFGHYFFETCFLMNRPDVFIDRLGPWHQCLRDGFKTLPERFGKTRSDCHAWSAHPLYHYFSGVVGIRPGGFGFKSVEIVPQLGPLPHASATLAHARGAIRVELNQTPSSLSVVIELPASLEGVLVLPGKRILLHPGVLTIEIDRPHRDSL